MCGIAGVFGANINREQITACHKALAERGPNNSGYYQKNKLTFIHTRLSILDLSSIGNQPMIDENTGTVLVFNGEIYNFKELQNKINANIKPTNDSQVLLNLFLKYDVDCFKMLRGMFAIAIWQPKKQKLILVRDRFGIKPLYYTYSNNVFYFGSDIKALEAIGIKKTINNVSIKNYLVNGILENNSSSTEAVIRLANVLEEKGENQAAISLIEEMNKLNNGDIRPELMKLKLSLKLTTPSDLGIQIDKIIENLSNSCLKITSVFS
mgnify:CR=1 FL=1